MESESFYVSRLESQPAPAQPTPAMTADEISMKIFENAMDSELLLRELTPEQRTQIFNHDGEAWTAAKVLRRMAQHLREHYPWMLAMAEQFTAHPQSSRK
jgi:hypothetical protein